MRQLAGPLLAVALWGGQAGAQPAGSAPGAAPPPAADAMLVLDASGSMWGQLQGRAKIELAREAVASLLRQWPSGQPLGLMAYGHRSRSDCRDIELLRPVSALPPTDRDSVRALVEGLQPKGMTPISESVREAARHLKSAERPATVILVSDGEETCKADPCAVGRELEAKGVDFTAHVIGFDIARGSRAQQQLQCLADATGGRYIDARSAGELSQALGSLGRLASDACAGFAAARAFMPGTALAPDGDEQTVAGAKSYEVERLPDAAGPRECQSMCLQDAGCMAWRFEAKDFLFVDHPRCFRYGAAASLRREDKAAEPGEMVSGVRDGARVVKQGEGFAQCVAAPAGGEAGPAR